MRSLLWQLSRTLCACFFVSLFAFQPQDVVAQAHVVSSSDLQKQVVDSSHVRQRNLDQVNRFFSSAIAQKALKDAHIDSARVQKAVANLSDQELAKIAAKTQKAQSDFAAGSISDHALVLIVVAIAVILLIVLVAKLT